MMAGLAARATAQHVHIAPLFGKLSVEEQEACSRHFLTRHGDGDVTATWDGEPPAETTVLVQGRPSESTLHRCKALHTLIIPFAGLPNETKEAVRALRAAQGGAGSEPRPALRVMNLHINAGATAEMAVTLLLAAMKRVVPLNEAMHRGDWSQRFEPTGFGSLVEGCVAVVLGFGAIGTRVATVLLALGAGSVRVVRGSHPPDAPPADVACGAGKVKVYSAHQLRRAMRQATVVVVTCPLTDATRDCIGSAELDALAKGAVLVNVGRGKVVNEEALYQALQSGQLGGAGIDVWYNYPTSADSVMHQNFPFHELENVVMSPHRGGRMGEERRMDAVGQAVRAVLETPVADKPSTTAKHTASAAAGAGGGAGAGGCLDAMNPGSGTTTPAPTDGVSDGVDGTDAATTAPWPEFLREVDITAGY